MSARAVFNRLACALALVTLCGAAPMALAQSAQTQIKPLSGDLANYDYPYPVQNYDFTSQRDQVHMTYMDVQPLTANGKVALLLHGKNFCSDYWQSTIQHLTRAGYRVIAPDQIGFCKSSKPENYQYSLAQLAENTTRCSIRCKSIRSPSSVTPWAACWPCAMR